MKRLPASQWLGAYAILCFSIASLWTEIRLASPLWLGLVFILLIPALLKHEMGFEAGFPKNKISPLNIAIGLGLWLPVLIFFVRTAGQEFPFGGDHDHHWLMEQALLGELGWYLLLVPVALVATFALARKTKWAFLLWILAALVLSTQFEPKEFLLRYPAGFYLLAAPFNVLINALGVTSDALFANRLVNVLSIPIYAFLLRPLLVRRWPDSRLLLLAAVFLLQKDWVYYFTTTYLEPWALICVFLSLELCVSEKEEDVELAPALAGIGCMFKEQAVFALTLATLVFLWRKRKRWGWPKALMASGFYFLPFFVYYSARANSGIWRKVDAANWDDLLNLDRWDQYYVHFEASLGGSGQFAFAVVIVLLAGALCISKRRWIPALAALAVLGAEVLFIIDKQSAEYLGYPRFHLLSWPLLAVAAVLLYEERPRWRQPLVAVAIVAALLQLPPTIDLLALAGRPSFERNYVEQYYAPVHFPIRELLGSLPQTSGKREIVVNIPVGFMVYAIGKVYRQEFERFANASLTKSLICQCQNPAQVILLLDVARPDSHAIVDSASSLAPGDLLACTEKLRQTCGKVVTVAGPDKKLVGAIAFTGEGI